MRIKCCIPYCRRTKKLTSDIVIINDQEVDLGEEWICQKHWSVVPPEFRREHINAKRELRKRRDVESDYISFIAWRKCKEVAIELAFGVR